MSEFKVGDDLTQARLKQLLNYDPLTGVFTWLVQAGSRAMAGDVAGTTIEGGYRAIRIDGTAYRAHRLAFLWMLGWMPVQVDHIFHIRNDNRWSKIRPATQQENSRNQSMPRSNISGFIGVCWLRAEQKWRAQIRVDGKQIHLGFFSTFYAACMCRHYANIKYGFHENHGRSFA